MGFSQVDRGELPLKAWKDCLRCPKFQACDEIPMLKHIAEPTAHPSLELFPILNLPSSVTLPTPRTGTGS
jgi:hypothetical protein